MHFRPNRSIKMCFMGMVNVLKFQTLFSFCSQIKCWFSGLEFTNFLSEQQTWNTLVRLLLQKQSDLGLPCLSRPFWLATSVQKFRKFTVLKGTSEYLQLILSLFDLILYVPSTIFQLNRDGSSWVEPVLS